MKSYGDQLKSMIVIDCRVLFVLSCDFIKSTKIVINEYTACFQKTNN
jgi:hypothetical protein